MKEPTQFFMDVAWKFALNGTCSRRQVGAILVQEGRIISTGYNGAPARQTHCKHPVGEVFTDEPCRTAVHAEANAIAFAARFGTRTEGATLYTTDEPCYACALLIVQAGVSMVWYDRPYREHDGLEILNACGVGIAQQSGL